MTREVAACAERGRYVAWIMRGWSGERVAADNMFPAGRGRTLAKPSRSEEQQLSDTRIAPDPFAVVLPALAALGAVASIAAVNWMAEERTPERSRARRKAGVALKDLENCCIGLQETFRRLHKSPKLFAGEGSSSAGAPLKFGMHGPRVGQADATLFKQSINDVASMLVLAGQNAFDVMSAIEDGEISPPDEVFYGFGEAQEQLNKVLADRATLKDTVDAGTRIALDLTKLVQELKKYRAG